jgi:prepilin-type N-terminal cleavage/methylation domain-containing protein
MRRGFTLIEMMIAIGLGSMICYASYVYIRVAAQSVTAVNQLSLENRMLRTGMAAALDELDFWTYYDPIDRLATYRGPDAPLRDNETYVEGTVNYSYLGRPFKQLTFDLAHADCSFDFNQADPRLWFRGSPEHIPGTVADYKPYGDYALHTKIDHTVADRRWYPQMLDQLSTELGFYGVCDYMPGNALYSYYDGIGKVPGRFGGPVPDPNDKDRMYPFRGYPCSETAPRDVTGLGEAAAFVITRSDEYMPYAAQHMLYCNSTNYTAKSDWWHVQNGKALERSEGAPMLLCTQPVAWPTIALRVNRFMTYGRPWATAKVIVENPVTGKQTKLWFNALATTLRGARRQRHLDPGS